MAGVTSTIILGFVRPLEFDEDFKKEALNEVSLMFALYSVFCFTDWIPDIVVKFYLGYGVICIVGGHFLIGVISVLIDTMRTAKFKFKVFWAYIEYSNTRKKNLEDIKERHRTRMQLFFAKRTNKLAL